MKLPAPRRRLQLASSLALFGLVACSPTTPAGTGPSAAPGAQSSAAPQTAPTSVPVGVATPTAAGPVVTGNGKLSITFNKPIDPATLTPATFTVFAGARPVSGTVGYSNASGTSQAVFTPDVALSISTAYTVTITRGVRDTAGNPLASEFTWSFTTGSNPNTIIPTLNTTSPLNAATGVGLFPPITATFLDLVDPASVTSLTFTVMQGSAPVPGRVTYAGRTAAFTPLTNLTANTGYTAAITTGIKDLNGAPLASGTTWTFTTGQTAAAQPPVDLGTAASYAVLAGSTFATTGPSVLRGDLGFLNGLVVTGFPPASLNGAVHISDAAATKANLDVSSAFAGLAARSAGRYALPAELGGFTLAPGLYASPGLTFAAGDLTLDAKGDPSAMFIFQSASDLALPAGRKVLLTGGAVPANVFWQVGGAATLGTFATMNGTIVASGAIAVGTGTIVNGRALSQGGPITLDSVTVLRPF